MFFLILHVIFASSFTLLIKGAHQRQADVVTVGAINYITAAVAAVPFFLVSNPWPVSWGAVWTGGSMGLIYFIAYFFVIFAIQMVGASSTTVVSVLSILMPIGFAALFLDESPTLAQSMGIGLALFSLLLIGGKRPTDESAVGETTSNPNAWWILLVFFLLCGLSRMAQDGFNYVSQPDQRPAFLLSAFVVASIPSMTVLLWRRHRPRPLEWGLGIFMGLANVSQTLFILQALEVLESYIVFTLASGGAIVLTTLVATGLMGERLSRRASFGISLAVVALILLRWLPNAG